MDDAVHPGRRLLYSRLLSGADVTGLFTRPPHLAIADELRNGLPVLALARVCERLLRGSDSENEELTIAGIAKDEGFSDLTQFSELFYRGTGMFPADWQRRFGRQF